MMVVAEVSIFDCKCKQFQLGCVKTIHFHYELLKLSMSLTKNHVFSSWILEIINVVDSKPCISNVNCWNYKNRWITTIHFHCQILKKTRAKVYEHNNLAIWAWEHQSSTWPISLWNPSTKWSTLGLTGPELQLVHFWIESLRKWSILSL